MRLVSLKWGTQLWIDYVGNSFLRYMVRMLTQTMINVGLHKLEYQEVERLLLARKKRVLSSIMRGRKG